MLGDVVVLQGKTVRCVYLVFKVIYILRKTECGDPNKHYRQCEFSFHDFMLFDISKNIEILKSLLQYLDVANIDIGKMICK